MVRITRRPPYSPDPVPMDHPIFVQLGKILKSQRRGDRSYRTKYIFSCGSSRVIAGSLRDLSN